MVGLTEWWVMGPRNFTALHGTKRLSVSAMIVQKMPSFTHINGFAVVLDDSIMAETERTMIMSNIAIYILHESSSSAL